MRFPILALVAVACSAFACTDEDNPPPKVFVYAQIGPGTEKGVNDATACKLTTEPWLDLGTSQTSVESGTKQSESRVSVTCSVKPEGAGYRVSASAALERRGSFTVTGLFKADGQQTGISGSFTRGDTGTFRQNDCVAEYGPGMGVGRDGNRGRVWAKLTCQQAAFVGGQDRTCLGTSEFKFENCD